jgi:hypothetical protein
MATVYLVPAPRSSLSDSPGVSSSFRLVEHPTRFAQGDGVPQSFAPPLVYSPHSHVPTVPSCNAREPPYIASRKVIWPFLVCTHGRTTPTS